MRLYHEKNSDIPERSFCVYHPVGTIEFGSGALSTAKHGIAKRSEPYRSANTVRAISNNSMAIGTSAWVASYCC